MSSTTTKSYKRTRSDCVEVLETNPKNPKILKKSSSQTQLHLDFGQKTFGHVRCKLCGMIYTYGQFDDEIEHTKFHKKFQKKLTKGISFDGWTKERIVKNLPLSNDRIILVLPSDSKRHLKRVDDILSLVDSELGYVSASTVTSNKLKSFLYIKTGRVVGCVMVESITEGFRVITDENNSLESWSWSCSDVPESAVMGINRIWVLSSERRKGLAKELLDTARNHFKFGYIVPKHLIAFSDPTPDGKNFATNYCQTSNFLVYRWTTQ